MRFPEFPCKLKTKNIGGFNYLNDLHIWGFQLFQYFNCDKTSLDEGPQVQRLVFRFAIQKAANIINCGTEWSQIHASPLGVNQAFSLRRCGKTELGL